MLLQCVTSVVTHSINCYVDVSKKSSGLVHYAEDYGSISRGKLRSDVIIMRFSLVLVFWCLSDVLSSLREDEEVLL